MTQRGSCVARSSSTVGTTIEWYDFFLYSIVTGLVFAKLYFPKSHPLTGTLEAFDIYAVGLLARPAKMVTVTIYFFQESRSVTVRLNPPSRSRTK
jgi:hypothetical protein